MNIPKNKIKRYLQCVIYSLFLVSLTYLAGCKGSVETEPNANGNQTASQPNQTPTQIPKTDETKKIDEIKGFVLSSGIWADPVIPVCWESMPENQSTERGWVEEAVESAWDANSNIDFTGWGLCERHRPGLRGIRIAVIDTSAGASTVGLGEEAVSGKKNGIKLVFRYSNWNKWCAKTETSRESCIRANAVHEFGHGLAFAHEQIREDTPESCDAEDGGSGGDRTIGNWDANSIMNYCNNARMRQSGALSPGDIATVQEIYGTNPRNTE